MTAATRTLSSAASLPEVMAGIFATAEVIKMAAERALELLAALRPQQLVRPMDSEQLSAALRADGVAPGRAWVDGSNARGCKLEEIRHAQTPSA